jgi:isopentenyl-diphosphate Delta-isomerase
MKKELLNIVSEEDFIIGQDFRGTIHKKGLLHREVHVYFITPDRKIIFQHRAKNKDTFPDLLDATVGGHVDLGDTYKESAVREVKEETGLEIREDELVFLSKERIKACLDEVSSKTNNAWIESYFYNFKGKVSDLKIEQGKSLGFESWSINDLKNINEKEKRRFIPYVINFVLNNLLV